MEEITSTRNSLIRYARALSDKKVRESEKHVLLEGVNLIKDLDASLLETIFTVRGSVLDKAGVKCYNISSTVSEYLSGTKTSCGVFAVARTEIKVPENLDFIAVLDGITDPGNLGTIVRTGVALGITELYLLNCCDLWNEKTVRASMGGVFSVNAHKITTDDGDITTKGNKIIPDGYKIFALDMSGKDVFSLPKTSFSGRVALVVGSEARGLSHAVRSAAHEIISLPMTGNIESLNAAVAFSVIGYVIRHGQSKGKTLETLL